MFEQLVTRKVLAFPPWGEQDVSDQEDLIRQPGPPDDWMPAPGMSTGARRDKWNQFVQEILGIIGRTIWPALDEATLDWPHETLEQRHLITAADLSVMLQMQHEAPPPLDRVISTKVSGPCPSSNLVFFQREDDSTFGRHYMEYDASLALDLFMQITPLMNDGFDSKSGTTAKQFKRRLQRPRAYQMAKAFGIRNFRHLPANTAQSPSTISGHAIAGLIMGGSVFDSWISTAAHVSTESFEAMQQYTVDIGDRRVMAGVHYPSDNISSWILGMRMADSVFKNPSDVKKHLYTAITQRSMVYQRILAFKGDAYTAALRELKNLEP